MQHNSMGQMNDYLNQSKRKIRRRRVFSALSAAVVLGVVVNLMEPASTLTREVICGLEEHTHAEACYADGALICGLPEHAHTEDCYALTRSEAELLAETPESTQDELPGELTAEAVDDEVGEAQDVELTDTEEQTSVGNDETDDTFIPDENPDPLEAYIITEAGTVSAGEPIDLELVHFGGMEPVRRALLVWQGEDTLIDEANAEETVAITPETDETVQIALVAIDANGESATAEWTIPGAELKKQTEVDKTADEEQTEVENDDPEEQAEVEGENAIESDTEEDVTEEPDREEAVDVETENTDVADEKEAAPEAEEAIEETVEETAEEEDTAEEDTEEGNTEEEIGEEADTDEEVNEAETDAEADVEDVEEEKDAGEEEPASVLLTFEGEDFTVTLKWSEAFSEDAALLVREIDADSEDYAASLAAAEAALNPSKAKEEAPAEEIVEEIESTGNIEEAETPDEASGDESTEQETGEEEAGEETGETVKLNARFFTVAVAQGDEISVPAGGEITVVSTNEGAMLVRIVDGAAHTGDGIFADYQGEALGIVTVEAMETSAEPEPAAEEPAKEPGEEPLEEPADEAAEPDCEAGALVATGEGYTVTMTYEADAQIPADAALAVREIPFGTPEYAEYFNQAGDALSENWDEATALPRFFDITILCNEEEIQPAAPVSVQIALDEAVSVSADDEMRAIHFAEDAAQVLEAVSEQPAAEGPLPEAAEAVSFDAESFSVYGIVPTATITKKVITADGETFEIHVTYGKEAEIPEGARLTAEEITAGSDPETYNTYTALSARALTGDAEAALKLARLFDIAIVDAEGAKIEPSDTVSVEIRMANAQDDVAAFDESGELAVSVVDATVSEQDDVDFGADDLPVETAEQPAEAAQSGDVAISVVHFAGEAEEPQVLTPETDETAGLDVVTFETESFSLFEVVFTDSRGTYSTSFGYQYVIYNAKKEKVITDTLNNNLLTAEVTTAVLNNQYYTGDINGKVWTFVPSGEPDCYYILKGTVTVNNAQNQTVTYNGQFLTNIGNGDGLKFVNTKVEASQFKLIAQYDGMYDIQCAANNNNRYLSLEDNNNPVHLYQNGGDNQHMYLLTPAPATEIPDGARYAIIGSVNGDKISTLQSEKLDVFYLKNNGTYPTIDTNEARLSGLDVTDEIKRVNQDSGIYTIDNNSVSEWIFTRVGTSDTGLPTYNISTKVMGEYYYLHLGTDGVSVSSTPQAIEALRNNDDTFSFRVKDNDKYYYLNLDNGESAYGYHSVGRDLTADPSGNDRYVLAEIVPDTLPDTDKIYAIFNPGEIQGNYKRTQAAGLTADASDTNKLVGVLDSITMYDDYKGVEYVYDATDKVALWKFEDAGDGYYYLNLVDKDGNRIGNNRLSIGSDGNLKLAANGTGNDCKIKLVHSDKENLYFIQSAAGGELTLDVDGQLVNSDGSSKTLRFIGNNPNNRGVERRRMLLAEYSGELADPHYLEKLPVTDLESGKDVMVYKYVVDPQTGTEHYYALSAADGTFKEVFDEGGHIGWRENCGDAKATNGNSDYLWKFTDLGNGYYSFYNAKNDVTLYPNGTSEIPTSTDQSDGVALAGRDDNSYASTILAWDADNSSYYSLEPMNDGNKVATNSDIINGNAVAKSKETSATSEGNGQWFFASTTEEDPATAAKEKIIPSDLVKTEKGTNLYNTDDILIYVKIPEQVDDGQGGTKTVENLYAVSGTVDSTGKYGTLVPVEEKDGKIIYPTGKNLTWSFAKGGDANNPDVFTNIGTGKKLALIGDGTVVNRTDAAVTAVEVVDNSKADSTIIYNGRRYMVIDTTTMTVQWKENASNAEKAVFYFAANPVGDLETVETVNNTPYGIKITMYDFAAGNEGNNGYYSWKTYNGTEQMAYLGQTDTSPMTTGLVRNVLGNDGYPVLKGMNSMPGGGTTYGEGTSLQDLFKANSVPSYDANHLFIQSTLDSTGYFEYSSFDNYAYLTSTGDFRVYKDVGSPLGYENEQAHSMYFERGNFMPFNDISVLSQDDAINYTLTDSNGYPLNPNDPNFGEPVYLVDRPANYYNGMIMEAKFYQTKDGMKNGEQTIYQFNGDDDLWIFVDGVLLVDLGGTHDARDVQINFSTGEITYGVGGGSLPHTIKQAFRMAGKLPDGTSWDDSKVDNYFRGNTFVDYSPHDFKMFYMERGAGASNLHLRFNLSTVAENSFQIAKQLTGDGFQQNLYNNKEFEFEVYYAIVNQGATPQEVDYNKITSGNTTLGGDGGSIIAKTGNGDSTFNNNGNLVLKSGETATFNATWSQAQTLQKEVWYYAREVGVGSNVYKVNINGNEDNDATSDRASASARPQLMFENVVESPVALKITKAIDMSGVLANATDAVPDETFKFNVLLDNKAYYGDYYVTRTVDNNGTQEKHYYTFGEEGLKDAGTTKIIASQSSVNGNIEGIPAGYTVEIEGLLPGTNYTVTEVEVPLGFELVKYNGGNETEDGATGSITDTGTTVTVTNKPIMSVVKLIKVSSISDDTKLQGAEFKLYYYKDGSFIPLNDINAKTDENGEYVFSNLPVNQYYAIKETKAPDGYNLPSDFIARFHLDSDGKIKLYNENLTTADTDYPLAAVSDNGSTITVKNTPGARLPATGGMGTLPFTIAGLALILCAAMIMVLRRKDNY